MASHEYHFISRWCVEGDRMQVYNILDNPMDLTRWWPTVYLEAKELEPGDENGIGKIVALVTKGWLPYTLRWQFRSTEKIPGERLALVATGDFEGQGVWTLLQSGKDVDITFDWRILAEKPLLRYLSFCMKPIFSANHRWAMKQGELSLRRELAEMKQSSTSG